MKAIPCLLLAAVLVGCRQTAPKPQAAAKPRSFNVVEIPTMLDTPEKRAEYVAKNYWNNFDFADTAYIRLPEITEQAFADYVNVLQNLSPELAALSVRATLSKAEADTAMYAHFAGLFEKYLYDPNSPMRNEEIYIPVLEAILASDKVAEADKIRPRYRFGMALKNRPGAPAADFTYKLADGRTGTLYGLKAEYTLLFIDNPGCQACRETIALVTASELVNRMLAGGRLKILALYPDEDLKTWRNHASDVPNTWIDAYDDGQKIRAGELYDLKAIPTLYLLSADKKVILKDAPFGAVEQYLAGQQPG